MTVLSGQTIRRRGIFTPFSERMLHLESSLSFGCGPAGYDVRCREDCVLAPGAFALLSTLEHFTMPADVLGRVHDKSTLARMGMAVQATVIEPGWRGYLTLEVSNNHPAWSGPREGLINDLTYGLTDAGNLCRAYTNEHTIVIRAGQPIAQIVLDLLDLPAERPYAGRYQDQPAHAVGAVRVAREHAAAMGYDSEREAESSLGTAAREMSTWK